MSAAVAQKAFGLAVLLLCGYAITLAGHYEMFNPPTPRSFRYFPTQEKFAGAATAAASLAYIVAAFVRS